ncbi:MAG: hypothetical protein AABY68_11185 [Pseudomonadota bacterium]
MKLAITTSLTLAGALALSLAGCESIPPEDSSASSPPDASYSVPSVPEPPAAGNTAKPATLSELLRNTQLADPAELFAAASTAIKLNRLTDAGVLYQEAQIRRATDMRRFPPNAEAQATIKHIERLKVAVSTELGPKLLDKPRLYALIAQRLESRDCATGIGYEPAWTYKRVIPSVDCTGVHQQKIKLMRDLSVLLSFPDYAEAAQLAEYYRSSSSSVRELAGLKEGYLHAIETMRTIERHQKRRGLSQRL